MGFSDLLPPGEDWSSKNSIATHLYKKSIELLLTTQATTDTMDPAHERYPSHQNMLRLARAIPRMVITADKCASFNEFAEKTHILNNHLLDLRHLAVSLNHTGITEACYLRVLCDEIDCNSDLLKKWRTNLAESEDWPW